VAGIGTLNENPLHAGLKDWFRRPGDAVEAPVAGFVADLLRGDELIEIQTAGFSSLARKLDHLLDHHRIRVVHPIAAEKWILEIDDAGARISRRKSPLRGIAADVCAELVSFPSLLSHPNFVLVVALVQEEEVRQADPSVRRRRGWAVRERRLLKVVETLELGSPESLHQLLPPGLPDPFRTSDLADALGRPRHLARQVAYCLREAEALEVDGRDRDGIVYRRPRSIQTSAVPRSSP